MGDKNQVIPVHGMINVVVETTIKARNHTMTKSKIKNIGLVLGNQNEKI